MNQIETPQGDEHASERLGRTWNQPLWEVERHRRLIEPGVNSSGIFEFYTQSAASRYIALPKSAPQTRMHEHMLEERLPVFSVLYTEDLALLHVPLDAQRLDTMIGLISRDIPGYREIIRRAGQAMRQTADAGFGLPMRTTERSVLGGIAHAVDQDDAYGAKLFMVPPYNLSNGITYDQVLSAVDLELDMDRRLNSSGVDALMASFKQGLLEDAHA